MKKTGVLKDVSKNHEVVTMFVEDKGLLVVL